METCEGFVQPLELALYITGLLCTCFGSLGPPFVMGLCVISAPWAPLCAMWFVCAAGVCVCLSVGPQGLDCTARLVRAAEICMLCFSQHPGPTLYDTGLL